MATTPAVATIHASATVNPRRCHNPCTGPNVVATSAKADTAAVSTDRTAADPSAARREWSAGEERDRDDRHVPGAGERPVHGVAGPAPERSRCDQERTAAGRDRGDPGSPVECIAQREAEGDDTHAEHDEADGHRERASRADGGEVADRVVDGGVARRRGTGDRPRRDERHRADDTAEGEQPNAGLHAYHRDPGGAATPEVCSAGGMEQLMTGEPGVPVPLEADAAAVLHVLSRGYRKLTAHDVAHAHSLTCVTPERVQTALDQLESAGFVQRYTPPPDRGDLVAAPSLRHDDTRAIGGYRPHLTAPWCSHE